MRPVCKISCFFLVAAIIIFQSCRKESIPTITTSTVTEITRTTAKSGGIIIDDGGSQITSRGICWSTNPEPDLSSTKTMDGSGGGTFTSEMTGLFPYTKYYLRAYAVNSEGTAYGDENTFITSPAGLATIGTIGIKSVTASSVVAEGSITDDGGLPLIEAGICWSANHIPTTGDSSIILGTGTGSFSVTLNCLSFATTYFIRPYAVNSCGIVYGEPGQFSTPGTNPLVFNPARTYGSVLDIDGNCYKTVLIEGKTWMAENLRTSRYNDGTPIPNITDNSEWISLETQNYPDYDIKGAFCWYNNDSASFENGYGKLYNFGTVNTNKLCPAGWHVPTFSELFGISSAISDECYLDGYLGGRLMETGTNHWIRSNSFCINNESGFTALPGGLRDHTGTFLQSGYSANFWTTTGSFAAPIEIYLVLPHGSHFGSTPTSCSISKIDGLSVRCVKD